MLPTRLLYLIPCVALACGTEPMECLPEPQLAVRTCLADPSLWSAGATMPALLSDTGCFSDMASRKASSDLVAYGLHAPLFSDQAAKQRWLALPPGGELSIEPSGRLTMPVGTVLVKQFDLMGLSGVVPVETRVMIRSELGWEFYSWLWRPDGLQADLTLEYTEVNIDLGDRRQVWAVPGALDCQFCHGESKLVLGPVLVQLDLDVCYGDGPAVSQLEQWRTWGLLDRVVHASPPLVSPSNTKASLQDRARSYLHSNCAHCHQPGGWTPPGMHMDLRWQTSWSDARVCEEPIQYLAGPNTTEVRLAPGDPERSHVYTRMRGDGLGKMPASGTLVHRDGLDLVGRWIESLNSCAD